MKPLFLSFHVLLVSLYVMPSGQAHSLLGSQLFIACIVAPSMQANPSTDTLVFKTKISYSGKKVKNLVELKAILETANDAETMRLFKKFKTTSAISGVFILLGGLIGIALIIVSRGQLRKVTRRFNDVKMGRANPSVSFQGQPDLSDPELRGED